MKKSITVNAKPRGRPATGQDPVSAVRLPADLTRAIDLWAEKNGAAHRSEAIRRLVELGLAGSAKSHAKPSEKNAAKAKELAARTIDRLVDSAAHPEEQASRKRRLLKGPEEFNEVRVDRPKAKK